MKKEIVQDERVLSQKRKIGNDAFQIIFLGLFLSIFVQSYIFNADFSQYAVEVILLIVGALYVIVRNITVGNNIFESNNVNQRFVIINSIICGIIVVKDLFKNEMGDMLIASLITFLCATASTFVVLQGLYFINKKKQMKIDSKLDDEEEK